MNRKLLSYFENIILIKIEGRNIDRFLFILYKDKIELLEVTTIDRRTAYIKIYERDFEKINRVKSINKVEVVEYCGKLKIKDTIKKNKLLIFSLIMGYIFLLFLSNIIFDVVVIHDSVEIRNIIYNELKLNNIKRLRLKQKYESIELIEEKILANYKDKIEWIEVVEIGTKYIVRVEERKIIKLEEEFIFQDIIATKDAIVLDIMAESGVILSKKNDYVKKGDIVISGKIMNGEKIMDIVKASGKIFGEVWYNIKVEFPLIRSEQKETGLKKTIYSLKFLDIRIPIIDLKPYKNKRVQGHTLIANSFLPFRLIKEKQYEVTIIDYIYSDAEALIKAEELAYKKIEEGLHEGENIISGRILKYYEQDQKIHLEMFFKVREDITGTKEISLIDGE